MTVFSVMSALYLAGFKCIDIDIEESGNQDFYELSMALCSDIGYSSRHIHPPASLILRPFPAIVIIHRKTKFSNSGIETLMNREILLKIYKRLFLIINVI